MLKWKKLFWNTSFLSKTTLVHHQPSSINILASQLSKEPTKVAENKGLGFMFVGDIFGNRVNSGCTSYCYFLWLILSTLQFQWETKTHYHFAAEFKNRETKKWIHSSEAYSFFKYSLLHKVFYNHWVLGAHSIC